MLHVALSEDMRGPDGSEEALVGSGRSVCEAVHALARGEVPRHQVNPEALDHPRLRDRVYAHAP